MKRRRAEVKDEEKEAWQPRILCLMNLIFKNKD